MSDPPRDREYVRKMTGIHTLAHLLAGGGTMEWEQEPSEMWHVSEDGKLRIIVTVDRATYAGWWQEMERRRRRPKDKDVRDATR